jgi:hypothetical protein
VLTKQQTVSFGGPTMLASGLGTSPMDASHAYGCAPSAVLSVSPQVATGCARRQAGWPAVKQGAKHDIAFTCKPAKGTLCDSVKLEQR